MKYSIKFTKKRTRKHKGGFRNCNSRKIFRHPPINQHTNIFSKCNCPYVRMKNPRVCNHVNKQIKHKCNCPYFRMNNPNLCHSNSNKQCNRRKRHSRKIPLKIIRLI
jgi:hypothetical protein